MPQPKTVNFDMPDDMPEGGDMLYPRDGAEFNYFDQPEERTEMEREEKNEEYETVPFLKGIHKWFDEQIAEANKLENITLGSPVSTEAQVLAHQIVRDLLVSKKASFPKLEDLES